MEPRDDSPLTRPLAPRTTRRTALSGLAGCGFVAGLLGPVGRRGTRAGAAESGLASLAGRRSHAAAAQDGAGDAWRLSGDVMEACRCTVTCPCNFASDPTETPCGSIVGWHIREGHHGETRLDGLNLVAYLLIPGNAFAGGWTLGFYLDERASPAQAKSLGAIFGGQAGGWPAALSPLVANPLPPKHVPIRYELANGEVRVSVPGLLEVGTEHVPHPLPGLPPLDLQVGNLAVPFYTGTADVRRSTVLRLTDPDLSFAYAGRSALIGRFTYEGP